MSTFWVDAPTFVQDDENVASKSLEMFHFQFLWPMAMKFAANYLDPVNSNF